MFKLKKDLEKVYTYDKDDVSFKLVFKSKCKEDMNFSSVTSQAKDAEDSDDGKFRLFLTTLRSELISWEGIQDEDGVDVPFSEENQKLIFDQVTDLEGVLSDLITLYVGPKGKN